MPQAVAYALLGVYLRIIPKSIKRGKVRTHNGVERSRSLENREKSGIILEACRGVAETAGHE